MVEVVRHQDVAECIHRNTVETGEGGHGARALSKRLSAAARQGGYHCKTQDIKNTADGEGEVEHKEIRR